MEKSSDYMENIIALVSVDEKTLPLVSDCDILTATDSFYHMDRMADFNVMILVTDGVMYVSENDIDYEIRAGELLFLKNGLRHFGKIETLRGTRWIYVHFSLPDEDEKGTERVYLPKKTCGLAGSIIEEKLYMLCKAFTARKKCGSFAPMHSFMISCSTYVWNSLRVRASWIKYALSLTRRRTWTFQKHS